MVTNKESKMKIPTYRNTKQRKRILEVLSQTDKHPTASWVYDKLKPEFPSLSLGTVYRNLAILEEQGLLIKLHSGSTFDRYDAIIEPHAHFVCKICASLYDLSGIELDKLLDKADSKTRHHIQEVKLSYSGICDECLNKEKS